MAKSGRAKQKEADLEYNVAKQVEKMLRQTLHKTSCLLEFIGVIVFTLFHSIATFYNFFHATSFQTFNYQVSAFYLYSSIMACMDCENQKRQTSCQNKREKDQK